MKKTDRLFFKIACYIFGVLAAVVLFEKVIGNLPSITSAIHTFLRVTQTLCLPFLIGFMIAYVMNPFVYFFERHTMKKENFFSHHPKVTRTLAILLIYTIVIGGIVWIAIYLVPEIKTSVITFATQLPAYTATLNDKIDEFFLQIDFISGENVNNVINRLLTPLNEMFQDVPTLAERVDLAALTTTIIGNVFTVGRAAFNIIMGIFIAFYMLFDKEGFSRQIKKTVLALFSERRAQRIYYNAGRIHNIFQNFIIGKALDSLIIGILAFIGLNLIHAPLVLVLSLIIGVTNMIPYFGPFLGGIPSVIITLLISPIDAIWVGLFILALQQFDGNFLGPKILGNSLDISPLWIILAVIVGGALMGPLGMFIGVPIFATIKMFCQEFIDWKYRKKYQDQDPMETPSVEEPSSQTE
nr:AI-2E family transporter [Anaerotignum lactatifermentans]